MNIQFWKVSLVWGFILWLVGYLLGFLFFAFVPTELLGWAIMPFGVVLTLWVLWKKVLFNSFRLYVYLGFIWTILAIVLDYFLLVQVLKPEDGYYKLDVYLYYLGTLLFPLLIGWIKSKPDHT